jgi:phage terminase small subunit
MPRPRKPTAELEARGAFVKDPQRAEGRADAPEPEGEIGDPPEYLSNQAIPIWHQLKAELLSGVCGKSDRDAFALLCELAFEIRAGSRDSKIITQYIKLLGLFGMTPADRSRLKSDKPKKEAPNPFAALLQPAGLRAVK